jgi:hypothetical protein
MKTDMPRFNHHILEPSVFFYDYGDIEVKYTDENGNWSDWELASFGGHFDFIHEGDYSIQARIWINRDLAGRTNYWIYSHVIVLSTIDEIPPEIPENFSYSFVDGHPHFTWNTNTEWGMKDYKIFKKHEGDSDYTEVAILPPSSTEWVDYNVTLAGIGNKTKYLFKIMADDINSNYSSCSEPLIVTGGGILKKILL